MNRCNLIMISQYLVPGIIFSIMMRWLGSNCILHRATGYIIIPRNLVAKSLRL